MFEILSATAITKPPVINVTPSENTYSLPRSTEALYYDANEVL